MASKNNVHTIAVVGAGQMGNGIAHSCAQYGHKVYLFDQNPQSLQTGLSTIKKNLQRQVSNGTITPQEIESTHQRIQPLENMDQLKQISPDMVVEAIVENISIKQTLLKKLESLVSEQCIIATNTSSIGITSLSSVLDVSERCIGVHFMNPVPLMKLVEIIPGLRTDETVLQHVVDFVHGLNKTSVVSRDYPGFIANRILLPMLNEAAFTLYEGIANIEDIDTAMKLGMNHPMGPLTLADFIGIDTCVAVLDVLYQGLGSDKYAPCPLLINMVHANWLGRKAGIGFYDYSGSAPKANTRLTKL